MKCDLKKSHSSQFTIIAKNVQLKYPKYPIVDFCPLWRNQIIDKCEIDLTDINDLDGIKEFFEGLVNESIKLSLTNCYTILELSKKSGSNEIANNANQFILDNVTKIETMLNDLIQSNSENSNHEQEIFLSHNYNQLLKIPELLQKIEIHTHMRILELAVKYNDHNMFNFHDFINFVIQMLNKPNSRKYSILLSLFNVNDFTLDEIEKLYKCENFDKSFIKNEVEHFISIIKDDQEKIKQLEIKYEQSQSQIYKLNLIVDSLIKNPSFATEIMKKINPLIPENQQWKLNGQNEATLSYNSHTIIVKSSSTFENRIEVNPCYLFTNGGWDCWAAHCNERQNSFILIEFDSPVAANFLKIISRKSWYNETPQVIQIFAKNKNTGFVLLASFNGISCGEFQTRFFRFDNSSSYSSYKILFKEPRSNANTISLSKLNLGELPILFL